MESFAYQVAAGNAQSAEIAQAWLLNVIKNFNSTNKSMPAVKKKIIDASIRSGHKGVVIDNFPALVKEEIAQGRLDRENAEWYLRTMRDSKVYRHFPDDVAARYKDIFNEAMRNLPPKRIPSFTFGTPKLTPNEELVRLEGEMLKAIQDECRNTRDWRRLKVEVEKHMKYYEGSGRKVPDIFLVHYRKFLKCGETTMAGGGRSWLLIFLIAVGILFIALTYFVFAMIAFRIAVRWHTKVYGQPHFGIALIKALVFNGLYVLYDVM